MTLTEATNIINFLSKVRMDSTAMKGHVMNSLNALMQANDPASVKFCQAFNEALNRMSSGVLLNESAPAPSSVYQPPVIQPQQQPRQAAPAVATPDDVRDYASRLLA